jgi:hypothetical protein
MKKILSLSVSLLLLSIASQAQRDDDDDRSGIKGSGNVITKTLNVQAFEGIELSGVYTAYLTQGIKEEVRIEAEDNLQDLFEVKNEGNHLIVKMKEKINIRNKKPMKVYITFKNLKSMDLKTVGNINSEKDLQFEDLAINNTGVGNVRLSGTANSVVVKNKGVGNFEAADFVVQKMDIENTGVGFAEVNAEKELKVKDSFLGKVKNRGNATAKRLKRVTI